MKITEMIKRLEALKDEHGDLEVIIPYEITGHKFKTACSIKTTRAMEKMFGKIHDKHFEDESVKLVID